jgi:copper chaperone
MEDKMSTTYQVSGMACKGCANAVTRAIKAVAPGATVEVRIEEKSITVEGFDDATAIAAAVDNAGFEFGGATV